MNIFVEGLLY